MGISTVEASTGREFSHPERWSRQYSSSFCLPSIPYTTCNGPCSASRTRMSAESLERHCVKRVSTGQRKVFPIGHFCALRCTPSLSLNDANQRHVAKVCTAPLWNCSCLIVPRPTGHTYKATRSSNQ